jgi:hypothetical protein
MLSGAGLIGRRHWSESTSPARISAFGELSVWGSLCATVSDMVFSAVVGVPQWVRVFPTSHRLSLTR